MPKSGENNGQYSVNQKVYWWLRFWVAVTVVSGAFATGAWKAFDWVNTRVSEQELLLTKEELNTEINKRERITDAKEQYKKIERTFNKQERVLDNVHENLIRLMAVEGVRVKPMPLPRKPGEEENDNE